MALDKKDFDQIEKIVEKSADKTKIDLRKEITGTKSELKKEIHDTVASSENRIIAVLSREITDLAEINRQYKERSIYGRRRIAPR